MPVPSFSHDPHHRQLIETPDPGHLRRRCGGCARTPRSAAAAGHGPRDDEHRRRSGCGCGGQLGLEVEATPAACAECRAIRSVGRTHSTPRPGTRACCLSSRATCAARTASGVLVASTGWGVPAAHRAPAVLGSGLADRCAAGCRWCSWGRLLPLIDGVGCVGEVRDGEPAAHGRGMHPEFAGDPLVRPARLPASSQPSARRSATTSPRRVGSASPDDSAGIDSDGDRRTRGGGSCSSGSAVRVRITVRCVIASSTTGGTGDRGREHPWHVGVCGDDGVNGVRRHRHERAADQQRPRVPGRALPGEGDDGDRGDDDDAVHDQRPRPPAPPDPGASGQIGERREDDSQNAPAAMNTVPATAVIAAQRRPSDSRLTARPPKAADGGLAVRSNQRPAPWSRPAGQMRAGWLGRQSARSAISRSPRPPTVPQPQRIERVGSRDALLGETAGGPEQAPVPLALTRPATHAANRSVSTSIEPLLARGGATGRGSRKSRSRAASTVPTECAAMSATS